MLVSIINEDLAAARSGDRAALERVLMRSRQDLRRYAEYHCSINDVEDAVQESLLALSRKLCDLRVLECFASWSFRIVKRECNRLKRGRIFFNGDTITDEILPVITPEAHEWRHDVAAALESLPRHYREIVLLRDLEGLTIAEISVRLQLSDKAVKSRLHRARARARIPAVLTYHFVAQVIEQRLAGKSPLGRYRHARNIPYSSTPRSTLSHSSSPNNYSRSRRLTYPWSERCLLKLDTFEKARVQQMTCA
ncbi:RNA polymerase sigma factor [Lysobacter sp. CA196]|uniref:RNA polymerase sigma factor n=1 Tax=Lysobacter sp. CA196 TaxID=3455606 RepID=UPI003F8D04F8